MCCAVRGFFRVPSAHDQGARSYAFVTVIDVYVHSSEICPFVFPWIPWMLLRSDFRGATGVRRTVLVDSNDVISLH